MNEKEIIEKCKIKKNPLESLHTIAFNIELIGITCFGDEFREIEKALEALKIIKEKPCESASTINYIKINKGNPKMLDYEHYCMTIKKSLRVNEQEFDLLKRCFENERM